MKRFNKIFVLICLLFIECTTVNAASGFSVYANSSTVIVGNTVKVSVKVASNDLGAWSYCISYDSSVLKLTSSTADASTCVKAGLVNLTGQTETFTFKALKSGSTKVTLKSAAIYSYKTETQIPGISIGSANIRCLTQSELEATYSTNAYLSSISVNGTDVSGETKDYSLSPEFNKETMEYTVTVPNEVEKGFIEFNKADSTASVNGGGEVALTEGSNSFDLVVTAQKGNQLTYKVIIVREELDPITITFNNVEYTIIRRKNVLPEHVGFSSTTTIYNETEIPALFSDIINYNIIGVKDSEGNIKMLVYDGNKVIKEYIEYKYGDIIFTPLDLPESDLFKYKVDGNKYVLNNKYVIYYGLDTSSNEKNYYLFNKDDGSFIIYDGTIEKLANEKIDIYKYIIYGLIGFSILLLLICIFGRKGNKSKKVKKEKSFLEDSIDNDDSSYFVDEVEETPVDTSSEFDDVEETPTDSPNEIEDEDEVYVEDLDTKEELKDIKEVVEVEPPKKTRRKKKEEVVEEPKEDKEKVVETTKELDIDEDLVEEEPIIETKKDKKKRLKEEKRKAKEEAKKAKDFDW